ncbi:MAG: hypothetical protein K2X34_04830 [Hyphomonadaceae bacterium]|nr:hypothetical protein [Hyphomonadaceae bacterium]
MSDLATSLKRWWVSTLTVMRPLRGRQVEDTPDTLERGVVYLIGDPVWHAAMICPCGCGATIRLSLLADDRPRWRASIAPNGAVTLSPSIWRVKGCKSHFFVRHGRILWARAAPPQVRR